MKHLLHWVSWSLCVAVALPIYEAHGMFWYIVALVALMGVMLMQWTEGRLSK